MSKQKFVIDIDSNGEVKIETVGFSGPSCLKESAFLKQLLGNETSYSLTPMFYQKDNVEIKKHINLCG